jgi:hypothetical protein
MIAVTPMLAGMYDSRDSVAVATICAEIAGSNTATACDITVKGRTPVLTLCRALLKEGYDATAPLYAYRGSTLTITISSIGEGARWTVRETADDPPSFRVLSTWKP